MSKQEERIRMKESGVQSAVRSSGSSQMSERGTPINNVVLLSGGLDSTTLLYRLKPNVKALLFNYRQRHKKEIDIAGVLCRDLGVAYDYVSLTDINYLFATGSQSGREDVPKGHYAEDSMKATIVPNRNMMMLSIAVAHAITIGAHNVWTAVHAGDHAIYPDCRPEFIYAMNAAVKIGNAWTPIEIWAPFVNMSKADIVSEGASLGVPFDRTWSCYVGGDTHCGRCGTCVERKEAFEIAGVKDPTTYAE